MFIFDYRLLFYFWRAPVRVFVFLLVGLWLGASKFFLTSGLLFFTVGLWFFTGGFCILLSGFGSLLSGFCFAAVLLLTGFWFFVVEG